MTLYVCIVHIIITVMISKKRYVWRTLYTEKYFYSKQNRVNKKMSTYIPPYYDTQKHKSTLWPFPAMPPFINEVYK